MMINWSHESNLPIHVLLTKSDKLKRGAAQNALLGARKELLQFPNASIQLFSSLQKTGVESLEATLNNWLEEPEVAPEIQTEPASA